MKLPSDPQRVFAILIGVEKYGGNWPLYGPSLDVLAMADWLLSNGVPGRNIQLFHNLASNAPPGYVRERDSMAERASTSGVLMRGEPERTAIDHALSVRSLATLGAPADSALYIYWSGHGLMTDVSETRYVITSDASPEELYSVNINQLCGLLRTRATLARFTRQLIIVDACSTWASRSYQPIATQFPIESATRQEVVLQERIFASLDGHRAAIAKAHSLSLFTSHLIELLHKMAVADLDLDVLWDQLKLATDQSGQPCLIDRTDSQGRPSKASGGRAPELRLRTGALAEIVEHQTAYPLQKLQRIFRLATACDRATIIPNTSRDLIWDLDEMSPGVRALTNLEWFALKLRFDLQADLREESQPRRRDAFVALNTSLSEWLKGCDQAALTQEEDSLKAQSSAPSILFVDVGPEALRVWVHANDSWRFIISLLPRASVAEGLRAAWAEAIEAGLASRQCHLDLAMEFNDLVGQHVSCNLGSETRKRRIGIELPFNLRLRERWTDRELLTNWLQSFDQSRGLMDRDAKTDWAGLRKDRDFDRISSVNSWLCIDDLDAPRWLACLRDHLEGGNTFVLAFRPSPEPGDRVAVGECVGMYTWREWKGVARGMCQLKKEGEIATEVVVLVDRPDSLPPGAADMLAIPLASD